MKNAFLGIDLQNDFCKPGAPLFVAGADEDVKRIADFIDRNGDKIAYICLTQDTHQTMDISHKGMWQDKDGNMPPDYTIIKLEDIKAGVWTPRRFVQAIMSYIEHLENQSTPQFMQDIGIQHKPIVHCIWPEHCIAGSEGAAIESSVMKAVTDWARKGNYFQVIQKGAYPLSEHFGAFEAQVPVAGEPSTQMNHGLIDKLNKYDIIYFAGEAKSHCAATTLLQIMKFPELSKKLVILEDCLSPVPGFEHISDHIYEAAQKIGIKFAKSSDIQL